MDIQAIFRRFRRNGFLAVLLAGAIALPAQERRAVTVHVAAAADLQPLMPLLARGFEKETGIHVQVSYGSSATLMTQILNGAPMDVFFSADYSYPERLVAANLTDKPTPELYAKGKVVLWERKDGPFQPLGLDALTSPALQSVAVTNPLLGPYGRAAVEAMRRMMIYDKVVPHFVLAENVAQAAQFASTGNTQLAFISLTLAKSPEMMGRGSYVLMPTTEYTEMRQCAVVMRNSAHHAEGRKFLEYVLSGTIQSQLEQYGLTSKDK
jgi:molybdate transport system substrate-binding protein